MLQVTTVQQATPAPPGISAATMLSLKRGEIRDQLKELSQRRNQLSEQRSVVSSSSATAKEIEARIAVIDTRTAVLEQQLFETNDLITSGLTSGAPGEQGTTVPSDEAVDAAIIRAEDAVYEAVFASTMTLLTLFVAWRGFRRFIWKRKPSAALPDHSPQLTQLQQSMDVIALEVERISEAQRYTARLMSERALGAGEAVPLATARRESIPSSARKP